MITDGLARYTHFGAGGLYGPYILWVHRYYRQLTQCLKPYVNTQSGTSRACSTIGGIADLACGALKKLRGQTLSCPSSALRKPRARVREHQNRQESPTPAPSPGPWEAGPEFLPGKQALSGPPGAQRRASRTV